MGMAPFGKTFVSDAYPHGRFGARGLPGERRRKTGPGRRVTLISRSGMLPAPRRGLTHPGRLRSLPPP